MTALQSRRGRPQAPGEVYEFHFYFRFIPGVHPPVIQHVLEAIKKTEGRKRRDILETLLSGGAMEAAEVAEKAEDSETEALLSDMFAEF
jgi:hypothetical protein